MTMRIPTLALLLSPLLLLAAAVAQDLTAEEVLANMKAEAQAVSDATFLLTGNLIDPDGTQIPLEVEVEIIPDQQVARATFIQPDALADNVVIFADDAVYNYIFMTNQVTIFSADDPDALGGLFGDPTEGEPFELTLDLEELFAGWEPSLEGFEESGAAGRYLLRLDNREDGAVLAHVLATVDAETWVPTRLELVGSEGTTLAEIVVQDFQRDQGLSVDDVTYLPEDAEVIDERN